MSSIVSEERVQEVLKLFHNYLKQFLIEVHPSSAEYNEFIGWAERIVQNRDFITYMNVLCTPFLMEFQQTKEAHTPTTLLDLSYIEGAPILAKPYQLPMREKEKGEKLIFSGYVRDVNDNPVGRTLIDLWHVDADSHYSSNESEAPPYNLRGRFYTDDHGYFEVETIVPSSYTISENEPLSELLRAIGKSTEIPSHINIILKRKGYETLITRVFLESGTCLDKQVPTSLITQIHDQNDIKEASFNFVMKNNQID